LRANSTRLSHDRNSSIQNKDNQPKRKRKEAFAYAKATAIIMKIITTGVAGTMESSDIIVRIEPKETSGIELSLESDVKQQYGDRIEQVIRETLAAMGVESAYVSAVDKGALDCTVEARTQAAAYRAANSTDYKFTE
jgi:citrate lyase subunit gamma (acyl carrier protein)